MFRENRMCLVWTNSTVLSLVAIYYLVGFDFSETRPCYVFHDAQASVMLMAILLPQCQ